MSKDDCHGSEQDANGLSYPEAFTAGTALRISRILPQGMPPVSPGAGGEGEAMPHASWGQTLPGGHGRDSEVTGVGQFKSPIRQWPKQEEWELGSHQPANPTTNVSRRTRDIGPKTIGARRFLHPIAKKSYEPPMFRRAMLRDLALQLKRLRNPNDVI